MSHEGIRIISDAEQARQNAESKPLDRSRTTPGKVRVLLSEGKGLEIDWTDGHKSAWSFAFLRDACPCATCIEERVKEGRRPGQPKAKLQSLLPMYAPPVRPNSAKGVGRYAIEFEWNDGHRSGIFSWEYLRRHCACAECQLERTDLQGTPN